MKIGIIGLMTSGKTTSFNLLTKSEVATETFRQVREQILYGRCLIKGLIFI